MVDSSMGETVVVGSTQEDVEGGIYRLCTVEPDLIATEMLVFLSKSSRNKNDSHLTIAIP